MNTFAFYVTKELYNSDRAIINLLEPQFTGHKNGGTVLSSIEPKD